MTVAVETTLVERVRVTEHFLAVEYVPVRAPDRAEASMEAFAMHPTWWVRMYAAKAASGMNDVIWLEKLASEETVIHVNSRWLALVPFGVGQFQNRQTALGEDSAILGAAQVAWLQRALAASTATWKIIASDMPLGVVVTDGPTDCSRGCVLGQSGCGEP